MHVQLFTLCKEAEVLSPGGGLSIGETFNIFLVSNFPANVDIPCVAMVIRCEYEDNGNHSLKVRIVDGNGRLIAMSNEFSLNVSFGSGDSIGWKSYAVPIGWIGIQEPGEHSVTLEVDERELAYIPFIARQA